MDAKFNPTTMIHTASGHEATVPAADVEKFRKQGYRLPNEGSPTAAAVVGEADAESEDEAAADEEDDDSESVDVDPFTQPDLVNANPKRKTRKKA